MLYVMIYYQTPIYHLLRVARDAFGTLGFCSMIGYRGRQEGQLEKIFDLPIVAYVRARKPPGIHIGKLYQGDK